MRICENCGGEIPPERRSDAKFCKDACKREACAKRAFVPEAKAFWRGCAGITRQRPQGRPERAAA